MARFNWLIDGWMDGLIDWLIDWLIGWFIVSVHCDVVRFTCASIRARSHLDVSSAVSGSNNPVTWRHTCVNTLAIVPTSARSVPRSSAHRATSPSTVDFTVANDLTPARRAVNASPSPDTWRSTGATILERSRFCARSVCTLSGHPATLPCTGDDTTLKQVYQNQLTVTVDQLDRTVQFRRSGRSSWQLTSADQIYRKLKYLVAFFKSMFHAYSIS